MDRGASQATVHGVPQSRTLLKQLGTHAAAAAWENGTDEPISRAGIEMQT